MKKLKFLDYIIILTIVLLSIILFFRFNNSSYNKYEKDESQSYKANLVYKVSRLRKFSTEAIAVGDKIYDELSDKYIGEVVDVKVENYESYINTNNGETKKSKLPEYYVLYIEVEADLINDKDNLKSLSGVEINLNSTHKIMTQKIVYIPTLLSIKNKE